MSKKRPTHPGKYVRHDCIEPLGLTITAAAKALGVTRQTLTSLVNCKSGVSPEMAVRLEKVFGSTAEMWLRLQTAYDLAQVMKRASKIKVKRLYPVRAPQSRVA
ncbi:MAG: HigA family addiction module antidote protein [Candidatus Hydrogenedentes bacterium]|nr:HigA family addiction module antidote protein [Candidatus Hydrogenedentota bacterium]